MSAALVTVVVILSVLIAGLMWAWLFSKRRTERHQSHAVDTSESSRRNRAWDAAVAQARNRHH